MPAIHPDKVYSQLCMVDTLEKMGISSDFACDIRDILDMTYRYLQLVKILQQNKKKENETSNSQAVVSLYLANLFRYLDDCDLLELVAGCKMRRRSCWIWQRVQRHFASFVCTVMTSAQVLIY